MEAHALDPHALEQILPAAGGLKRKLAIVWVRRLSFFISRNSGKRADGIGMLNALRCPSFGVGKGIVGTAASRSMHVRGILFSRKRQPVKRPISKHTRIHSSRDFTASRHNSISSKVNARFNSPRSGITSPKASGFAGDRLRCESSSGCRRQCHEAPGDPSSTPLR